MAAPAGLSDVPSYWLTPCMLHLNAMLDRGETFDIEEVRREARGGRLTHLLTSGALPGSMGPFGLLAREGHEEIRAVLDQLFEGLMEVNSRRKFRVENNGISLILAFFIEALQQWLDVKVLRL